MRASSAAFLSLVLALVLVVLTTTTDAAASKKRVGVHCRGLKNPLKMAARYCLCEPCHMCKLAWSKFSCGLIANPDMDASDGSEIQPTQPTLDPAAWFLTQREITASRNGVPRDDLSVFTQGNQVDTYAVGDELFSAVLKDIQATTANDSIYLSAWSVANVPFDPVHDKTGDTTGFHAVFRSAMARGVDFRALVWQNLLEREQNVNVRDFINALPMLRSRTAAAEPGRMIFDDRLRNMASSHHQKTIVLRHEKELVAYVGGIDLSSDRWDTIYHNETALREATGIKAMFNGWLDAHLRINGPAALDVGNNFVARWNSKTKPTQDKLDSLIQYKNPAYAPVPALTGDGAPPLEISTSGSNSVQITRTFSCKYNGYTEFAPKGERSLFLARLKAIREAKHFIYIEDQYFIEVPELLEALLEVLPRLQRVIVVVQRVLKENTLTGYPKYLFDMIAPLQQKFPNKFQVYSTKRERKLYIHSKVVLIDDVYVSIGSANWNRRSMTSDSEMSANVVDTQHQVTADSLLVAKTARDFRVRKFTELTGKSYAEIDALKFIDAANALDVATKDPTAILDWLEVNENAAHVAVTDLLHDLVDPDDTC